MKYTLSGKEQCHGAEGFQSSMPPGTSLERPSLGNTISTKFMPREIMVTRVCLSAQAGRE